MVIRFQSAVPNGRRSFPGIFALANGLRDSGMLSGADAAWVRDENRRADLTYTDPSTVIENCYDSVVNPGARSWFRESATDLIAMARRYTRLRDAYDVPWVELRSSRPGRIVYEDDVQVVAVPYTHAEHWPFGRTASASRPPSTSGPA